MLSRYRNFIAVAGQQCCRGVAIKKDDRYLLCSDGLTDMVSDAEIEMILRKEKPIKEAAEELLNTALEHGGVDNVTVILVEVQQEEERKG